MNLWVIAVILVVAAGAGIAAGGQISGSFFSLTGSASPQEINADPAGDSASVGDINGGSGTGSGSMKMVVRNRNDPGEEPPAEDNDGQKEEPGNETPAPVTGGFFGGGGSGGSSTGVNDDDGNQNVCSPGDRRCSGDALQKCKPDGSAWQNEKVCEYGCDSSAKACNPPPKVHVYVSPQNTEASVGSSFTVDVLIDTEVEIYAAGVTIEFDGSVVSATSAEDGGFLGAENPESKIYEDKAEAEVVYTLRSGDDPVSGQGSLATFTFETLSAGESNLTIVPDLARVDDDGNVVAASITEGPEHGSVTVQ